MFKRILFILGVSGLMSANSFHWQVDMIVRPGKQALAERFDIVVNGEKVLCHCGKPCVYLFFYYGMPVAYCGKHLPLPKHPNEVVFEELLAKGIKDEPAD